MGPTMLVQKQWEIQWGRKPGMRLNTAIILEKEVVGSLNRNM